MKHNYDAEDGINQTAQAGNAQENLSSDISYQDLVEEASRYQNACWAAHMTPDLAPYSQLGMQLALHHHGNLLSPELYPKLKQAETELRYTLAEEFGFTYTQFTHGGTFSNLQALWQARNQSDTNKNVIYGSEACHYSIAKACDILGITFEVIACNERQQIHLASLEEKCAETAPLAIIANMGTTATGAMDPIEEITAIAAKYDSWLHVDGAWGGFMLLQANELKQLISKVDSLSFDPHKALFQPRPCSLLFSHQAPELMSAIDYLSEPPEMTIGGSYGGEVFLPLWLNWKLLGKTWFIEKMAYRLAQAAHFTEALEQAKCKVINHGTGIVCFKLNQDHDLTSLIKNGTISTIKLNQTLYYRVVFAGLDTSADNILRVLRPFL